MKQFQYTTYIFILLSHLVYSQDLKEKAYTKACSCFENNYQTNNIDTELIKKCFEFSLEEIINTEELQKKYKKKNDSLNDNYVEQTMLHDEAQKEGYQISKAFYIDLQQTLTFKCSAYNNYMKEFKKNSSIL